MNNLTDSHDTVDEPYQSNESIDTEANQTPSATSAILSRLSALPSKVKILLGIFTLTGLLLFLIIALKPEAEKRSPPETIIKVEVVEAKLGDYPITVNANGSIEADTRGNLVAQISGEIVAVSDAFKTGGAFNKGDVLAHIDDRDYHAQLSQALANLSQADAAYRQEKANARQAEKDWKRLGNTAPAPDLVLRKPQLAAAKAQLDSAKAAHETAQINLDRTQIKAPYTGKVIRRDAALGQYVSTGSVLAEIFATDGVEARIPLSQAEFNQLGLETLGRNTDPFKVEITSTIGGKQYQWQATVTRTDSTFDLNTRQIDVVASVLDPFSEKNNQPALKIGQFVNAKISGRTAQNVFVLPNKSIRDGNAIFIVENGRLKRTEVEILWQDDQNALIESGVEKGSLVVTTSLGSSLSGVKVSLPEAFENHQKDQQSQNTAQNQDTKNNDMEAGKITP